MADSFQIEFASALLEEVFETLAQQVHHHHVVTLPVISLLITHEMQIRHRCSHINIITYSFLVVCG